MLTLLKLKNRIFSLEVNITKLACKFHFKIYLTKDTECFLTWDIMKEIIYNSFGESSCGKVDFVYKKRIVYRQASMIVDNEPWAFWQIFKSIDLVTCQWNNIIVSVLFHIDTYFFIIYVPFREDDGKKGANKENQ